MKRVKNIFEVIWCVTEQNRMQISAVITEKLILLHRGYVVQLAYIKMSTLGSEGK